MPDTPEGRPPEGRAEATDRAPDKPTDALTAIVSAIAAAKPTTPDTADPNVALAFSLGWQMAELSLPPSKLDAAEHVAGELRGLRTLDKDRRVEILVYQVRADLKRLQDPLERGGLTPIESLAGLSAGYRDKTARPGAVKRLHGELLAKLTAADFRLGKAYGLGVALANLCRVPATPGAIRDALTQPRVSAILRWLDDLATALPPHAGHSVAASLVQWHEWATLRQTDSEAKKPDEQQPADDDEKEEHTVRRWSRQGELWRALLSGEKRGSEMLEITDWLEAARTFEEHLRRTALKAVRSMPLAGAAAALFVLGIVLIAVLPSTRGTVAGLVTVLGALGLTWKGVGTSIGTLLARLEQPLFGAVTDDAITTAITLVRADVDRSESGQARRVRLAHRLPARRVDVPPERPGKPTPPDP